MQELVRQNALVRVVRVPEKAEKTWGFAEQVGVERQRGENDTNDVFVHATDLQKAGLSPEVAVDDEYRADIVRTNRGLRAVNLGKGSALK